MAEYIKRDAALRALCQVSAPTPSESYIVEKCIEKVNRLPMIEVVRCKDCKHYKPRSQSAYWSQTTPCCTRSTYLKFPPDGFCSYGEKREGEGV